MVIRTIYEYARMWYHALLQKMGIRVINVFRCFVLVFARRFPLKLNKYMVVAPHPDDEVFGCAGMMRRLAKMGKNVQVVILTQGEAVHEKPLIGVPALIAKRREMALNAGKILGLTPEQYTFLNWGDGKLHETKNHEMRLNELASLMKTMKPEVVFVPHISDGCSTDHLHATEIVTRALHLYAPSAKLMYYCVWLWESISPFRLKWRKSYYLSMNGEERAAKSKAIDAYILPVDIYGVPYSGNLYELPSLCSWKKELFFDASSKKHQKT